MLDSLILFIKKQKLNLEIKLVVINFNKSVIINLNKVILKEFVSKSTKQYRTVLFF